MAKLVSVVLLLAAGVVFPRYALATADPLDLARQNYHGALEALEEKRWDDFLQLRRQLDDYPLAIYLDYFKLAHEPQRVSPEEANEFLSRSADTPLPNRFLAVYLRQAGREQRWREFLEVMPREPNSVVLKCYYFRAQLAEGDKNIAWRGAEALWQYGRSRPDECDPLLDAWIAAGKLTDDLVWARLLAAFDSRQSQLMRYVSRKGSAQLRPWSDKLLRVYARPQDLTALSLPASSPRSVDIATHALPNLARYSPEDALDTWRTLSRDLPFDADQIRAIERAIALRSLFARTDTHREWLHGALDRLRDDELTGIRLRWALRERDWPALERTLALLSDAERESSVWRYWQAVALEARGAVQQATIAFTEIARERGYYSFLAADRLGRDYSFNVQPLPPLRMPQLEEQPALRRIEELQFHDAYDLAHSEWYKVLQDTGDTELYTQLAQLAAQRGWHRMAIDAATRARAWDALDVRFPLAFQQVFEFHANKQQVPSSELLAISRRESAFFPQARSPVGARGLMQVMPATGRQVARKINTRHSSADLFEIDHNVMLGSAYYRQLLDRFNGNRILALTAYNAGPHRVDRWRNTPDSSLPVDIWVETIPYKETRNYVQAVLAYNVVFQHMMGEDREILLTKAEQTATY